MARRAVHHSANQIAIQIVGFITGVLIVRSLEKVEYAQYSLAIALIAALTQLTDSGISAVLLSKGAEKLHDKVALAKLFRAGNRFRLGYGAVCISIGCLWLFLLLRFNGATLADSFLYVGLTALGMFPVLAMGVMLVLFRLQLDLKTIQRTGMATSLVRVGAIAVLAATGIGTPGLYLAITAAISYLYAVLLGFRSRPILRLAPRRVKAGPEFRSAVQATLPSVLVLIAAEQLLLTLLSVRGSPDVIAELNAMSRFGVAFALVNAVVNDIAVPIVARSAAHRGVILRRGSSVVGVYACLCACLVGLTAISAPLLIGILGPQYTGLEASLVCVAVAFSLSNIAVIIGMINNARGWTRYSWTYIPLIGLWFGLTAMYADLTSINSVVLVVMLQAVPAICGQIIRFVAGLRTLPFEKVTE